MALESLLAILVVALVCSLLAQSLVGHATGSWLWSTGAAAAGALLAIWLVRASVLPRLLVVRIGGEMIPVAWVTAGAFLCAMVVAILERPRTLR